MRIYDIVSSGDFEHDLGNMFDLLSYFRKIISAKESHLKLVKDLGANYDDEELKNWRIVFKYWIFNWKPSKYNAKRA